jgi:predicted dehydrogenase
MRDAPPFIGLRDLVRGGVIGEVHAVSFGGQHPLLLGKRAGWYFERGKHGGTINDIGVHAIDAIPWIIGQQFAVINAARSWNAFAVDFPHFQDAGQMMLTMANGCGVLGDVSYFAPDSSGYNLPFYWRTTLWGRRGVLETYSGAKEITIALDGEEGLRSEPVPPGTPGGYLRAFLHDIQGNASEEELNTAVVLRATRTTLRIQEAADQGLREVSLG